ncbi:unnamed protein product, partial [Rotaria socialis]
KDFPRMTFNELNDLTLGTFQLKQAKNATLYDVWVQYNKNEILGWYCRCPNGCRVVGCCSHIASVIWFLSFARYHPEALRESASSYLNSITDAPNYSDVSDDDGNESDDDTSQTLYTLA